MMCTQIPIKLFEVAKEVVVLTYMFEGNILDCFLRLKGFEIEPFTEITLDVVDKGLIRDLITLVPPNDKIKNYSMSATWWDEATTQQINDVSNYIRTVARNNNFTAKDVLWTVPKSRAIKTGFHKKSLVSPKGFTKDKEKGHCFLSAQTRATNIYHYKKGMFHCYSRRPLVPVSAYLSDYGCNIDFKVFATSEMVQWLWRGCIRDGKPMVVGIGSDRMYNYFMEWLQED